jgi:putative transposase
MATHTVSIKLPFLALNQSKRDEFSELQSLNTKIANNILDMPKEDRKALTTAHFKDTLLGSAWMNQTIRNARARTKAKRFKCLPLETNNQNWTLHKVGKTYSLGFGIKRGVKKRVPLEIHQSSHATWLDGILSGDVSKGTLKLWCSKKGIWFAILSASMGVPDATTPLNGWIGVDRGQNRIAVASIPSGRARYWTFKSVRHIRRRYARLRQRLQKAGKLNTVRKIENHERRVIRHINHVISKQIVQLAIDYGCGIRLEDLSGIRKNAKQRKKTKSDAGQNRDYWPFYQLEAFIRYKALAASVPVESHPPQYTSKSCHVCGAIGSRNRHRFVCSRCSHRCDAEANAGFNIGQWVGWQCELHLETAAPVMSVADAAHGVHDSPPTLISASHMPRACGDA